MFCPKCGNQLPESTHFCTRCGTRLDIEIEVPVADTPDVSDAEPETAAAADEAAEALTPAESEEAADSEVLAETEDSAENALTKIIGSIKSLAENLSGKKLAVIGGSAVAAVVLIVLIISLIAGSSSGNSLITYEYQALCGIVDDEFTVYGSKGEIFSLEDIKDWSTSVTLDRSSYALELEADDASYIYFCTQSKVEQIVKADEIISFGNATCSKAIWYLIGNEDYDTDSLGDLYLFNGSSSKLVAEGVISGSIAISPDGKTVAYSSDYDEEDRDYVGYVYKNGKAESLGKNIAPVAVSDNAKYIYYVKSNDGGENCYAQKGVDGDRVKLSTGRIYFNADLTEVLFSDSEKTYLVVKCGEKQRVTSNTLRSVCTPQNASSVSRNSCYFTPYSSFCGVYAVDGDSRLIYIDSKGDASSVGKNIGTYMLTDDCKTVFWTDDDGDLYYENAAKRNASKEKLAEEVEDFTITSDGKAVYYLSEDYELYYLKTDGDNPQFITDDCDGIGAYIYDDTRLVYWCDDELFLVNGKKAQTLETFDEDIYYATGSSKYIRVMTTDYDAYYGTDDGSFTLYDND